MNYHELLKYAKLAAEHFQHELELLDHSLADKKKLTSHDVYTKLNKLKETPNVQPIKPELILEREKLPHESKCIKNVVKMANQNIHIIRSFYDDGRIGEIFVTAAKQGNTVRGFLEVLSMVVSKALQYGMPPEILSEILRGHEFTPNGLVQHHQNIKMAASIPDLMSKFLDISNNDYTHCQVKPGMTVTSGKIPDEKPKDYIPLYGEVCSECSATKMVKSGACKVCTVCGQTSGCS